MSGCRFPGDVVCDPQAAFVPITYGYCMLSDENKNLWKKPNMQINVLTCVPATSRILSDFCNDHERVLKAAGLIQDKTPTSQNNYHQLKYVTQLNPCILGV